MIRIVADERERASGVPDHLRRMNVKVEFKMLDVADYIFSECAVERKGARDFISSLFSGRLFDQAHRISDAYKFSVMVVEGDFQSILSEMRNPRAFWGALTSLSLSYGLRIFFTQDTVQTAEFIYTLTRQAPFKRGVRPLVIGKPRMGSIMEAQIAVVESLPGIGPVLAERLLRQFGTVRKIFTASATELAFKGRIGRARANKISQFLDLPHKVARAKSTQARLGLG